MFSLFTLTTRILSDNNMSTQMYLRLLRFKQIWMKAIVTPLAFAESKMLDICDENDADQTGEQTLVIASDYI